MAANLAKQYDKEELEKLKKAELSHFGGYPYESGNLGPLFTRTLSQRTAL